MVRGWSLKEWSLKEGNKECSPEHAIPESITSKMLSLGINFILK